MKGFVQTHTSESLYQCVVRNLDSLLFSICKINTLVLLPYSNICIILSQDCLLSPC